jgi:hypothetical protein
MSVDDDDDKPTVVLDLNALKKQKLRQEEDLANIAQELEFAVGPDAKTKTKVKPTPVKPILDPLDSEEFAESFLAQQVQVEEEIKVESKEMTTVILFDFESDFFSKSKETFPSGYDYQIAKDLKALNKFLANKKFQICVFNYDVNPKAVNQLTAQIKQKFPLTKTLIMAKSISPEKAKLHAKTPYGANGYYQYPLESKKILSEFLKIQDQEKKVG